MKMMNENTKRQDGKYVLPLPLKNSAKEVPNNRMQVLQRSNWLKKKLLNNDKMLDDYKSFMEHILEKGYAKVRWCTPNQEQDVVHSSPWCLSPTETQQNQSRVRL